MIPVLQTDLLISLFEVMKGPVCQRSLAGTPKRSLTEEAGWYTMHLVYFLGSLVFETLGLVVWSSFTTTPPTQEKWVTWKACWGNLCISTRQERVEQGLTLMFQGNSANQGWMVGKVIQKHALHVNHMFFWNTCGRMNSCDRINWVASHTASIRSSDARSPKNSPAFWKEFRTWPRGLGLWLAGVDEHRLFPQHNTDMQSFAVKASGDSLLWLLVAGILPNLQTHA